MDPDAIQEGKPKVPCKTVQYLLQKHYGICPAMVSESKCYENQVFIVEMSKTSECNLAKERFIFKIYNSVHQCQLTLRRNVAMMNLLSSKGFKCPRGVPLKMDGKYIGSFHHHNNVNNNEKTHFFLLMTFLPGHNLHQMEQIAVHKFEQMGELLAKIHLELQTFQCTDMFQDQSIWQLHNAPKVREFANYVIDHEKRELLVNILDQFESKVLSVKDSLRSGYLHGDFNDTNIMVDTVETIAPDVMDDASAIPGESVGVIDFDDAYFSPYIFDVGTSIMYVLQSKTPNPLKAAAHFLYGYEKIIKLTEQEVSLLYYCITVRFAQSLILGLLAYHKRGDPISLMTQERGWTALETIINVDWTSFYEESQKLKLQ